MQRIPRDRRPNAGGEPRPRAAATQERRLLGVGCRVEPVVTHPAPPPTRTCAMNASGSSDRAAAALLQSPGLPWSGVVSSRALPGLLPAHALPDGACPPVGRLGLPSPPSPVLGPATTAPSPSRGPSLVARSPIPCLLPSCVVSHTGSWPGGSPRSRQGLWSPGPPRRDEGQGDRWLSHVPEFPLCRHAPLSDPGGVLRTRQHAPRTPAFQPLDTVGFPPRSPLRGAITRPVSSLHPASSGPVRGGTRVHSCPVGSTVVRWDLRLTDSHPRGHTNQFHGLTPTPTVSG
jgi:hypothetical protein